jgi:hypothetical protein
MTAYRQQALICAAMLQSGPGRPRDLKAMAPDAAKILLGNVYGWFVRVERGLYALTEQGRAALIRWPQTLPNVPHDIVGCPEQELLPGDSSLLRFS